MHGGRELIYVPPTSEQGESRRRDNVTELRRPTSAPGGDARRDSVIPFPVHVKADEKDGLKPQKSRRRKTPSSTSPEVAKADREN